MIIYQCKECGWTGLTGQHCYYHSMLCWHSDFEVLEV